jgi:hypothetical protein
MRWIKLALVAATLATGSPALAVDPSVVSMGAPVPKGGGKGDPGPSSNTDVYRCVVSDWSRPLRRPSNSGFVEKRPPDGEWVCDPPRKSGGYAKSDVGATCACDAYGGRWAGKIEVH